MGKYRVEIKKSAVKELKKIPNKDLPSIIKSIEELSQNPYPVMAKKLSGDEKYRLRVGNYRILYQIFNATITIIIVKVAHRKDVYKSK